MSDCEIDTITYNFKDSTNEADPDEEDTISEFGFLNIMIYKESIYESILIENSNFYSITYEGTSLIPTNNMDSILFDEDTYATDIELSGCNF